MCVRRRTFSFLIILLSIQFGLPDPLHIEAAEKEKSSLSANKQPTFGIEKRIPWKTSRLTGSPEPPPKYAIEPVFTQLSFSNPVELVPVPGTNRMAMMELDGAIYTFPNEPNCKKADLFLDMAKDVAGMKKAYGIAFHPNFETNRTCYLSYVLDAELPEGTRVSEFKVTKTDPPKVILGSEKIIITWKSGGHNGACIRFGPDGYLYISTGDGGPAFPPDPLKTGQDVSDLLASVLRIDVDHPSKGMKYSIPADNPFVNLEDARGEVWSFGHRNPWKMAFDPFNGSLWVGDVGWEMWEMIYRIQKGGNYGWSVVEGSQAVHSERNRGPTPILPPTVEHSHTEARSITGGYVYRGKRLPELVGAYIYGDYVTGKVWAAKHDGSKLTSLEELTDSSTQIVTFGEDGDGELYLVGYGKEGSMYRLIPNPVVAVNKDFPKKLSETGLFSSTKNHRLAPGVISYSVNAEPWADHTTANRFVAVPDNQKLGVYKDSNVQIGFIKGEWQFPTDSVLVKTISLEMEPGNPASTRHLETQVLHFNVDTWNAYSYIWNEDQTDARLSEGAGFDKTFSIKDTNSENGVRQQTYHFASRTECILCHTTRAGSVHAFKIDQLNKSHNYGKRTADQLQTLSHIGLFSEPLPVELSKMAQPFDSTADLTDRARAYLHVNCAHCHRRGGGGTAAMDLQYQLSLEKTNLFQARPTQGTFGIHAAEVLAPGDPFRSVIIYRMSKLGRGRMPHFGSNVVDQQGIKLISDWVSQVPLTEKTGKPSNSVVSLRQQEQKLITRIQHSKNAAERGGTFDELFSSISGALVLLRAIDDEKLAPNVVQEATLKGTTHADIRIRDLFERFVPEENRVKRLGTVVNPQDILALQGIVKKGRALFTTAAGVQCRNCHKIGNVGKQLGPPLDEIAKKYDRAKLLESMLEPSKTVDKKFVSFLIETKRGRVFAGLLAKQTDQQIVLRDATNKEIVISAEDIELIVPQRKSLMPELLLRDLTAQEVADLLAYLETLKPKS